MSAVALPRRHRCQPDGPERETVMTETPKETVPRPRSPGVEHALLWRKADSTWVWILTAQPGGRTRLVTRLRARPDWRHPVTAITGTLLLELGDFAMMRRMLLGIR